MLIIIVDSRNQVEQQIKHFLMALTFYTQPMLPLFDAIRCKIMANDISYALLHLEMSCWYPPTLYPPVHVVFGVADVVYTAPRIISPRLTHS